jgi:hypothetical protein
VLGALEVAITEVKTWSLDVPATILDASNFGSTWKLSDSGIKEWSGSLEAYSKTLVTSLDNPLWNYLGTGTKLVLKLAVGANDYFYGTVVFGQVSPSQSHDGLGAESWSFTGHGPLTRVS